MAQEVLIERPTEWLENHAFVHIESVGRREILTANKHGDLQAGNPNRPTHVNVSDDDVEFW